MANAKTNIRFWALAAIAMTVGLGGCAREKELFFVRHSQPLPPQVRQLLRDAVLSQPVPASLREPRETAGAWASLQDFYGKRDYQPAWSTSDGPRRQAAALIGVIPILAAEGLDTKRYPVERLALLAREVKDTKSFDDANAQRRLADLDVELTYTYLSLVEDLASGSLQPEKLGVEWYVKRDTEIETGIESKLAPALHAETPGEMLKALRALTPSHAGYQRLTQALATYRGIAARGGWGEVPAGSPMKMGDSGPRVAALRARLSASGDLVPPSSASSPAPGSPAADGYDEAVAAAVSHFQCRHGLEPTGKVGDDTLAELNVPVLARIRQIEVNLERWRWLPASLGDRYVLVNVPDFRLDVVEDGQMPLSMRVIVGKLKSRTPSFNGRMTYVELNPDWNLPDSIAANEIAPKLAADPDYLANHGMELVRGWSAKREVVDPATVDPADLSQLGKRSPYRLRQRSGAGNPLGQVKFMFPNPFDVYLHGTPGRSLFARTVRSFSHGCVRLEKPSDLAAYLLKENSRWTPKTIQAAIASGEHQTILLPSPIPVYILYWTAWVGADGTVELRRDLYGHDATVEQALDRKPPVWIERQALRENVIAAK